MASVTLGRVACPVSCGHTAAQVKLKTDKGEKTAYPYVHCAGCGVQLHTRSTTQAEHLLAITRKEGAPAAAVAPPSDERGAVDTNPPPAPKKPAGWLLGGFGGAA